MKLLEILIESQFTFLIIILMTLAANQNQQVRNSEQNNRSTLPSYQLSIQEVIQICQRTDSPEMPDQMSPPIRHEYFIEQSEQFNQNQILNDQNSDQIQEQKNKARTLGPDYYCQQLRHTMSRQFFKQPLSSEIVEYKKAKSLKKFEEATQKIATKLNSQQRQQFYQTFKSYIESRKAVVQEKNFENSPHFIQVIRKHLQKSVETLETIFGSKQQQIKRYDDLN